jgi:hypothetical protein
MALNCLRKTLSKIISERIIEFTDTVRPVCLPFRPEDAIDDAGIPGGRFINTASWETSVPMLSNSFCHHHQYKMECVYWLKVDKSGG